MLIKISQKIVSRGTYNFEYYMLNGMMQGLCTVRFSTRKITRELTYEMFDKNTANGESVILTYAKPNSK